MSFLPDPWLSDFRSHLEIFEGRIAWMYADGVGWPSCGVGPALFTPESAQALPWVNGNPVVGWHAIKSAEPNHPAQYYAALSPCRLPEDAIDALRDADIAEKIGELAVALPGCAAWPPQIKQVALDFAFNLGTHKFATTYPKMIAAIRSGDWKTAAAESHRNNIQDSRNQYTASLILSALNPPAPPALA